LAAFAFAVAYILFIPVNLLLAFTSASAFNSKLNTQNSTPVYSTICDIRFYRLLSAVQIASVFRLCLQLAACGLWLPFALSFKILT